MSAPSGSTFARPVSSRGLILALVLGAQLMVVLDATIVTVALPKIESGLHFRSQLSLQWVINAYLLLFGGFLLLGGRAGDLYGRRKLFVIGLAVFTAASFANGLAQSTGVLIAGRAAQGLGAALVAPAVLSIIVATFPETGARTKALAAFSAVSAGGGAVGLLLGGVLTQAVSWRWIFLVNVPIGIATVLLAMRFVPESRAEDRDTRVIDIPGAVTVTGGVSLLVFAVVNAQRWGWSSSRIIGLLAGAAALLVAFVAIELRSRAPLIRLGIFHSRALSAANLTMFLFIAGQYTIFFFPTLYMQVVLGYSPLKTGLAYLPIPVGFVAGAVAGQRLIPRIGARATIVLGALLGAGGVILLSRLPDHARWAAYFLPGFLVNSAGGGLAFETIVLVATAGVSSDEAGLASGIVNTSQQLGAAIGLAALAAIAASRTAHLLHSLGSPARYSHALVSGFDRGLLIAGLLMLAAGLVAIVGMRRTDLEQVPAAEPQAAAPPAVVTGSTNGAQPDHAGEIVIAFDGSENARYAIGVAARELGHRRAAVLNVWEPRGTPLALEEEIDLEAERAQATAEQGARLAHDAGFDATAHTVRTDGSVGEAIVDYAEKHAPTIVVIGTRGLSGVRSTIEGSVTRHVTQHVRSPVLAVPPKANK
jgi:EmrB/QacA subfamily drug resistance transporter